MPDSGLVLVDDDCGVRTLVLNRPEQLNAFNQALCGALADALRSAEVDNRVRVALITGAGRAFSAGTDLYELEANRDFRGAVFEELLDVLTGFAKPLICAVNGIAVGLGATLLGHADLVFMAESARLRCPFTSLSLCPEAASSVTLPLLLGRQAAAWMLLSSEWIDAADAAATGLAWRVLPDDDLIDEAVDHARRIAVHPVASLVASKRLLSAAFADEVIAARRREDSAFDVLLRTADSRAAVSAFVSGRNGG